MVTWLTLEQSIQQSRPVELYQFTLPTAVYLYTSHLRDVEYGGDTYTAIGMTRSTAEISPADPKELTIQLPVSTPLVQAMIGNGVPPERIDVVLLRYQPNGGAAVQLADGPLTGLSVRGREATLRVSNRMAEALAVEAGGRRISSTCNHVLYDARCGVARTSFDVATTIATIDGRELTVASVGGNDDGYFVAGEIATADGERRMVVSQVGTAIRITAPFSSLATVGTSVTLYAGCDHSIQTCRDKFSNVVNFGGHPNVPSSNPWMFGLLRGDGDL